MVSLPIVNHLLTVHNDYTVVVLVNTLAVQVVNLTVCPSIVVSTLDIGSDAIDDSVEEEFGEFFALMLLLCQA